MASKAVRAVFTDMDGTLLNPQHQISEFTLSVLKQLKAKGIRFILCTGRPYPDVFATIRKCGLEPDFIITSNGACIHNGDLELIRQHDLAPEVLAQLVRLPHVPSVDVSKSSDEREPKRPLVLNFFQGPNWFTNELVPEAVAAFDPALRCNEIGEAFYTLSPAELTNVSHFWFQIPMTGHPRDLLPMRAYVQEHFAEKGLLSLTSSDPIVLEVMPHNTSKGRAVTEVAELLGVQLDEVACCGDGENDVSMAEIVGHAYVMANAPQAVKDALPKAEIIGSNAEDGVAKKLQELFA